MIKEIICINCPMGCRLQAELKESKLVSVTGNLCPRGAEYAAQEAVLPMRVLTGNMKAVGCERPFSVKTDRPVPKTMIMKCAAELKKHYPQLPVYAGDVIIRNILNTGSDIVATQKLEK